MSLIAKLVYSMLLLGLSFVLLRELWIVWFDKTIYIGRFDVVGETGKDDSATAIFPKRIVSAQAILGQQFNDYQTRGGADVPSDKTFILPGMTPLLLPPEVLSGIDITVQNINVRQVLTGVRRSFLTPNEVAGNVAVRDGSVLAAVDWPNAPQLNNEGPGLTKFLIPSQPSEQATAAYIACSLSWANAASIDPKVAAFPRTQFCDFGAALGELYALGEKASSPSGLEAKDSVLVRKRADQLRAHYDEPAVFPELYRLRADLLDLLPETERKQTDLIEVQEDRLRYAMLGSELRDLPEEVKRFAALALARPAILLKDGKLLNPPENWASLLRRYETAIRTASTSIGLIMNGDMPVGTGFIVGPNLMMTASFSLRFAGHPGMPPGIGQQGAIKTSGKPLHLCLGPSQSSCDPSVNIGDVVYVGDGNGVPVALVKLINHDSVLYPPLQFADPLPAANTLIGQYAYVIGYSFRQSRQLPKQFVERLLGEVDGHKRLMPGRILAFGQGDIPINFGQPGGPSAPTVFTSDISTIEGTGGGPLIELTTGRILGMSFAGFWKGERGKFAYAVPIPKGAFQVIKRSLRGETLSPLSAKARQRDAKKAHHRPME